MSSMKLHINVQYILQVTTSLINILYVFISYSQNIIWGRDSFLKLFKNYTSIKGLKSRAFIFLFWIKILYSFEM